MSSRTLRRLALGENVPDGPPRRYINGEGYVMCRWKVGVGEYVEALEHRLVAGLPEPGLAVHHIDGDKQNNDPDNLELTTAAAHASHHWRAMDYEALAEMYRSGMTTTAIAAQLGRNDSAVYRALLRHGVPIRAAR